jgi:hypothetical protein
MQSRVSSSFGKALGLPRVRSGHNFKGDRYDKQHRLEATRRSEAWSGVRALDSSVIYSYPIRITASHHAHGAIELAPKRQKASLAPDDAGRSSLQL